MQKLTRVFLINLILATSYALGYSQVVGTVVWSQSTMTAKATLKKKIKGSVYTDYIFDYPNGKPGFNIVKNLNSNKFQVRLVKPDGTIINDLLSPQTPPGEYRVRVRLKPQYYGQAAATQFWMEIWIE